MTWTQFHDMSSGGGTKEQYSHIFIEAPADEAVVIFYNRFGHNPNRVSCTCCGPDYSIHEDETLEQATGYERNCAFVYRRPDGTECDQSEAWEIGEGQKSGYTSGWEEKQSPDRMRIREQCNTPNNEPWGLYRTIEEFVGDTDVLVIWADSIEDNEKTGHVPEQGYVWRD